MQSMWRDMQAAPACRAPSPAVEEAGHRLQKRCATIAERWTQQSELPQQVNQPHVQRLHALRQARGSAAGSGNSMDTCLRVI
jgi:hypothetical protein